MNLPTTATALSPEDWLRVMSLIHPDNVNETLRILHARGHMLKVLERCRIHIDLPDLEEEIVRILNNEPTTAHPWPPEPQLEEPPQPEQA